MKNNAEKYAEGIHSDLITLHNGVTVDECSSLYDWIAENALDVEYTLNSQLRIIGVRIYVTLGGPACWIDTRARVVACSWGTDHAELWLDADLCDEITDTVGVVDEVLTQWPN